jgi:hypothetical protein
MIFASLQSCFARDDSSVAIRSVPFLNERQSLLGMTELVGTPELVAMTEFAGLRLSKSVMDVTTTQQLPNVERPSSRSIIFFNA